jgi:NAD dependent epimerase/dehydratase family enzyme
MLAKLLPAFRRGIGATMGTGEQCVSWVSLADAVGAIVHVLEHPAIAGPVNVASPNPVTNRQFSVSLAAALGRRGPRLRAPAWLLRVIFGRMARETILGSYRAAPAKLLEAGFEFGHPTIDAALAELLEFERDARA